ncbi:hypothetical protein [Fischerella sp.]|nr:hypothetical protein [Fischerella sp.]
MNYEIFSPIAFTIHNSHQSPIPIAPNPHSLWSWGPVSSPIP